MSPFKPHSFRLFSKGFRETNFQNLLYISYIRKYFANKKIALNCYISLATGGMLAEGQNGVKSLYKA
jgi:hypothetical protein